MVCYQKGSRLRRCRQKKTWDQYISIRDNLDYNYLNKKTVMTPRWYFWEKKNKRLNLWTKCQIQIRMEGNCMTHYLIMYKSVSFLANLCQYLYIIYLSTFYINISCSIKVEKCMITWKFRNVSVLVTQSPCIYMYWWNIKCFICTCKFYVINVIT